MTSAWEPVYLITFFVGARSTEHFALYVPVHDTTEGEQSGSLIHVVGTPMSGFSLELKRRYDPDKSARPHTVYPLGDILSQVVSPLRDAPHSRLTPTPRNVVEVLAFTIPLPQRHNLLEMVNEVVIQVCWSTR
jgi:hypothetical protein